MTELPEYRRPWWDRWAEILGEPRRRWRALDDRQRYQVGIVLRVILLGVVVYIAWPLALLVLVLFLAQYAKPYIPDEYAWARRMLVPTIVLIVAVTYPFYVESLTDMRLFGAFPDVGTAVIMGVYVIMAIGLNIVVGYAGLLDLGYVAFYAMGAYTCAWFASVQFANHKIHFGATGVAGAYFASFKSSTFPNDFNFNISAFILSMVILGGMGNVWGVMFGAAFLAYL